MKFAYPFYLYFGIVIFFFICLFFVYLYKNYKKLLLSLVSKSSLEKISDVNVFKIYKVHNFILLVMVLFFLISLSSPQWGIIPQEVKTHGIDVIVAIDTSKSMLTEDVLPNRLEYTKNIISLLLERLNGNRVGIIAFAGIAFNQCPLTLDISAAKYLLSIIDSDTIPYPGTKIGECIYEATKIFRNYSKGSKYLIIFSDGEDHDSSPLSIAQEAKKSGVVIFTVGVGTQQGQPIPIRDSSGKIVDYKKNSSGEIVTSKLNENLLYQIANETGGKYYSLSYGSLGISQQLYEDIESAKKSELKTKIYNLYRNRYHYFVFILIFLYLIEIFVPMQWYEKL